jgi:hypothetical protein
MFHAPHMIRRDIGIDPGASLAEVAQAVGARSVRKEAYIMNIDFTAADIAASGGTTGIAVQIDSMGHFCIGRMNATFWIVAALATAVAGSLLPMEPDPSSASNQMPNMGMLTCAFSSNSWQWQNTPTRMNLLCGTARFPNWRSINPVVAANDTLICTIVNNAAVAVRGQVSLEGYRIIPQN